MLLSQTQMVLACLTCTDEGEEALVDVPVGIFRFPFTEEKLYFKKVALCSYSGIFLENRCCVFRATQITD